MAGGWNFTIQMFGWMEFLLFRLSREEKNHVWLVVGCGYLYCFYFCFLLLLVLFRYTVAALVQPCSLLSVLFLFLSKIFYSLWLLFLPLFCCIFFNFFFAVVAVFVVVVVFVLSFNRSTVITLPCCRDYPYSCKWTHNVHAQVHMTSVLGEQCSLSASCMHSSAMVSPQCRLSPMQAHNPNTYWFHHSVLAADECRA